MSRRFFLLAVAALAACGGGGDGGVTPPPPPPTENLSVSITAPTSSLIFTTESVVHFTASGASNLMRTIPDGNYTWTLDGAPSGTGKEVDLTLRVGENKACVKVKGSTKETEYCSNYAFRLGMSCKVVAAHSYSEALEETLRITFSRGSANASLDVTANGDCTIDLPATFASESGPVRFALDRSATAARKYHPMLGKVTGSEAAKGLLLVLVPHEWRISGGSFNGQILPVSLSKAYTAGSDGLTFFEKHKVQGTEMWWYTSATYPSLPLPTALAETPEKFSSADADSIWKGLADLATLLGFQVGRPANSGEVVDPSHGLIFKLDSNGCGGNTGAAGCGGSSWNGANDLVAGSVTIKGESHVFVPTITHEMIHVLGFGHGCGWSGNNSVYCTNGINPTLTPSLGDVAYMQLYHRVISLMRKYNSMSVFSLAESDQGERVLELGLAEQVITHLKP